MAHLDRHGEPYEPLLDGEVLDQREAKKRPGFPVDPGRLLRALRRSVLWLALSFGVGCGVAIALAGYVLRPTYEATAVLVYEGVTEVEGLIAQRQGEMRTLVDSVTITPNLEKAARVLGDGAEPDRLRTKLTVEYSYGSNVFSVKALGDDPEAAANLANVVVDVFQEHRRAVENQRLEEHLSKIDEDVRLATNVLKNARKRYDDFREEHGIADLTTEQEQAIAAAAELRAAADLARAEATAQDVRLQQLRTAAQRQKATTVLTARQYSPEQEQLLQAQTDLTEASAQLSPDHPRVRALKAQVDALSARTVGSRPTVSDTVVGLNPTYTTIQDSVAGSAAEREAARQREESLESLTRAARERVARLSRIEGEASSLLATVRVDEAHLDELQATRARVADVARNPATGFRLVAPAAPPDRPVNSKKRLAILASVPIAFLALAALGCGLVELRGLRLVTPAEVSYWGGGPVVGTTAWPENPKALDALVAEMEDYVPRSGGRTLVVGASPGDRALAAELACRLTDGWELMTEEGTDPPDDTEDAYQGEVVADQEAEIVQPSRDSAEDTAHDAAKEPSTVTALVRRDPEALAEYSPGFASRFVARGWMGPERGPTLRRAARLADRVLVLVSSGKVSALELRRIATRLGRNRGLGFVVVGAGDELIDQADRAGDVEGFWAAQRPPPPRNA